MSAIRCVVDFAKDFNEDTNDDEQSKGAQDEYHLIKRLLYSFLVLAFHSRRSGKGIHRELTQVKTSSGTKLLTEIFVAMRTNEGESPERRE